MVEEIVLAERELLGFPDTRIEILMSKENIRVLVHDRLGVTELPAEAYFHPFAYGYVWPEPESHVVRDT